MESLVDRMDRTPVGDGVAQSSRDILVDLGVDAVSCESSEEDSGDLHCDGWYEGMVGKKGV